MFKDISKLCREVVALKIEKGVAMNVCSEFMMIIKKTLEKRLGETFVDLLPTKFSNIEKYASIDDMEGTSFTEPDYVDICRNGCVLFRGEYAELEKCPKCNSQRLDPKTTKPVKEISYWSIKKWIKNKWATPGAASLLKYAYHRKRETATSMSDIYDGSLWKNKFITLVEKQKGASISPYDLCFALSCDGTPIQSLRNASFTPVLICTLNLPPWVRYKFGAVFLAALIPQLDKSNFNVVLEPIIEEFRDLFTNGMTIQDADTGIIIFSF